jgi:SAM-dependent methyltransferase
MTAAAGSLDAVVLPVGGGREVVHAALAALKPLGRLVVGGDWAANEAMDRWLAEGGSGVGGVGCSVTSRMVLEGGRRAFVAERWGDAGASPRRAGAHAGAYKMSRYKAYHQMQAAVARLVPGDVRDVIEIGDSNGVIRDMLGKGPLNYFRAHYPPHDLQTLELIEDGSRDVFICDNTLEHVADPHAAVRQMARVIRPGGWLVLFAPLSRCARMMTGADGPRGRCRNSFRRTLTRG